MPAFAETVPAKEVVTGGACVVSFSGPISGYDNKPGATDTGLCQAHAVSLISPYKLNGSWSVASSSATQTQYFVPYKHPTMSLTGSLYATVSQATGKTYVCEDGWTLEGTNCVKNTCSEGSHYDSSLGGCVPDSCPDGQSVQGGLCEPGTPEPAAGTSKPFKDVGVCEVASMGAATCKDGSTPTLPTDLNGDGWSYRTTAGSGSSIDSCRDVQFTDGSIYMYCDVNAVYQNDGKYIQPQGSTGSQTPPASGGTGGSTDGQVNHGLCGGVGQPPCSGQSTCGGIGQPACACGGVGQPPCPDGTNGGGTSSKTGSTCGGPGQLPCSVSGQCGGPNQSPCQINFGEAGYSIDGTYGINSMQGAVNEGKNLFDDIANKSPNHGWNWTPWVPTAGCSVEPFIVGPFRGSMNLCEAANMVRDLGAYVFAFLTLFSLFNIFTGSRSD